MTTTPSNRGDIEEDVRPGAARAALHWATGPPARPAGRQGVGVDLQARVGQFVVHLREKHDLAVFEVGPPLYPASAARDFEQCEAG
ncbi:MAG: hypothetical protein OXU20_32030 [Myxococcales bacterium]|nr:hypothetical protein [Myxococcales bacterium]